MDFTLSAYKKLISTLQSQGFFFQTFEEYIQNSGYRQLVYWLNGRIVEGENREKQKVRRLEGKRN
jgi:hypothetical protein